MFAKVFLASGVFAESLPNFQVCFQKLSACFIQKCVCVCVCCDVGLLFSMLIIYFKEFVKKPSSFLIQIYYFRFLRNYTTIK